jgi:hypothetical protein
MREISKIQKRHFRVIQKNVVKIRKGFIILNDLIYGCIFYNKNLIRLNLVLKNVKIEINYN